jgi:hypothetical protein
MSELSAAALAYVRHVLAETGMSPSALAKKAKISSTTLTRALNDPQHKFTLTVKTLQKIGSASGVDPIGFLQATNSVDLAAVPQLRPGVYDEKIWGTGADFIDEASNLTLVAGDIRAGVWQEFSVLSINDAAPLDMRSAWFPPKECFALRVRDDSVDRFANPDDLLYCVRTAQVAKVSEHTLKRRALAIVERRSKDGFKFELTARRMTFARERWTFNFASSNNKLAKGEPITVRDLTSPEFTVLGIVTWVLRWPPWPG